MEKQVRISKGEAEAYVMPESVGVWEALGWTADADNQGEENSEAKSESTGSGE